MSHVTTDIKVAFCDIFDSIKMQIRDRYVSHGRTVVLDLDC